MGVSVSSERAQREPRDSELIIGLAAAVGTPLDRVQQLLTQELGARGYEAHVLRLSAFTDRFELSVPNPTPTVGEAERIDALMNRGNEARSTTGRNDILALCAVSDIRVRRPDPEEATPLPSSAFVLRQLKHPEEVYLLRETYGNGFHLLGVYCPRSERERHLKSRGASESESQQLIERDENEPSESGQHLRDTFHLSDVFLELTIDNEVPELARFIKLLFGEGPTTPSVDEFGMFQAFASSLRSAQLGRQVGASILNKRGDVLSVGTNEVPRFGGGVYWAEDHNDFRDHIRGRDSSDEAREALVEEFLERTQPGWSGMSRADQEKDIGDYAARLRSTRIASLTEFGRAVHAEAEAIVSAARMGVSPKGGLLYCTTFPCHVCARHIVAAGIEEVTYIEPYPKSRALELHSDSISIEDREENHVLFRPFVGVAPRRFARLFSMTSESGAEVRRKDARGAPLFQNDGPRLRIPYFSALDREKLVADELRELTTTS